MIKAKEGDYVFVVGTENPSTGYTWFILEDTSSSPVFEKISDSFITEPEGEDFPPLVGAPGVREFILKATNPGIFKVHFVYARPWEFPGWDSVDYSDKETIVEHKKFRFRTLFI